MLTGDPQQMADTLRRRRDELGIDEVVIPGDLADDFAPEISLLTG
jgi:hypothetical protein